MARADSIIIPIGSNTQYLFTQLIASASWVIAHGLGAYYNVTIMDGSGNEVEAEVNHISVNQTNIQLNSAKTGKAVFS